MPSSAVRTFSDPDDYGASIRATTAEMTVTGRGLYAVKIVRIDLHRLWMQRFSDNLPRVAHAVNLTGRAILTFRTEPGSSFVSGGLEMSPTSVIRNSVGEAFYQRTSGSASWGAMSLPLEEIAAVGEAFAGFDLTPPRDAMLVKAPPSAMTRLLRLHAAAGYLAERSRK